jgi:mRNA interferase HigB
MRARRAQLGPGPSWSDLADACSQCGSILYWFVVRIIARRALREFWETHADAEPPLRAWYHDVRKADWRSPADVKRVYANASIVADGRVVFNIGGNKYRLVVAVNYRYRMCYVRFIGTHQAYGRIDVATV